MKSTLKHVYLWLLIYFSGLGSNFFRTPRALYIMTGITLFIFMVYGVRIRKSLLYVTLFWITFNAMAIIAFGTIRPLFIGRYYVVILASYLIYELFGDEFPVVYSNIIFWFAMISLLFWIWHTFSPNTLLSLMSRLNLSYGYLGDRGHRIYYHSIFYTVASLELPIRNCGFCWEPGPFSVYLALALYVMAQKQGVKSFKFWVLVVAIITTFSTTGYFALAVILLYPTTLKIKVSYRIPLFLILLIIFGMVFNQAEFMRDKIIYQAEVIEQLEDTSIADIDYLERSGRVSGIIAGISNLLRYPFGVAGNRELSVRSIAHLVSGIGSILTDFGIFSIMIFLILLKSSKSFSLLFATSDKYSLFLILAVSLAGFSFLTSFSFVLFAFFGLWHKPKIGGHNTYLSI